MSRHDPTLTARRAGSVPEGTTVRHVDQLSEADLEAFLARADGERRRASELRPDDVVVFAGYYRVVPAEPERTPGESEAVADAREVVPGPR